ncbi:acyl-CoA dehydrogenase family protein [Acrocarpospora catenulata]|uniref:acyl-CoA dehydrogenase family protein n=1 Tax=Acrocarpospora catenulata TaxID=2836182 RepID=UPI001BDA8D6A|nr:acyl-CoA dehydrogenase family protein [Acrocarpospora catenulata]
MDVELSARDLEWREEVRRFLADAVTDELRAELAEPRPAGRGPAEAAFWRKVGERGWMSLTWPQEYGGRNLDALRRLILVDEFEYAGAPMLDMTITSLAPVIIRHGTPANKERWLPGIRSGEIRFALGYSEPDAGTDLAALRTSAVLDGEEWVVNGDKIWNTGAHTQTHEWLAVRTGPDPGHRGISIVIVPLDAPGVTVQPIWTWGDHRTNQVFFDSVRVPRDHLIGEVNRGWDYIVAALDNERGHLGSVGGLRRVVDELIEAARVTVVDGRLLCEDPVARLAIAELHAEVEVARLLSYQVASGGVDGVVETVPATMLKVLVTELRAKIGSVGMSLFGLHGQLAGPRAPLGGLLEHTYRLAPLFRFGGGTNEVMRDIIAQRGHGLPRSGRR